MSFLDIETRQNDSENRIDFVSFEGTEIFQKIILTFYYNHLLDLTNDNIMSMGRLRI